MAEIAKTKKHNHMPHSLVIEVEEQVEVDRNTETVERDVGFRFLFFQL